MPVMGAPDLTEAAIADVLAQTVPVKLLIIGQNLPRDFRSRLEAIAEQDSRIYGWWHEPALPSLSATWNRALQFVWACGGEEAWVLNNDTRTNPCTVQVLSAVRAAQDALFITAVGVTKEQYESTDYTYALSAPYAEHGGPDFSCFLISREGHEKYPFDEGFVPSHCEDCCNHREYMLGGDGHRIFSINLPYYHVGGGANTLKSMTPEARQQHEAKISAISRKHYEDCWGGPVNHERYTIKGDASTAQDGVTNPELQRAIQEAEHVPTH
jgi:hypothetical protein